MIEININKSRLKFKGELINRKVTDTVVLHHSQAESCTIYDIHIWHLCRGWSGCGYHFFIRKDGSVYDGRPVDTVGAHCKGNNGHTIGICLEGDFRNEKPTEMQVTSLMKLCHYLNSRYSVLTVKRHSDMNATDCPGDMFPMERIEGYLSKAKEQVDVKELQIFLNSQGITDYENKKLVEDGIIGERTRSAFIRLKGVEI